MKIPLPALIAGAMLLVLPAVSPAQEAALTSSPVSIVPHLIKFSGALPSVPGNASSVDVKFSLYAEQTGGEALWSETQEVSLDATGKYSVVLGATTAGGVPESVFASGQARWIGVTLGSEHESARTILVATPYSLKASDSETLGGHPVSDFKLKSALPAGGTDITQIDGTNGVVVNGSGTGPTVTLGLSNSYLQGLGNEIYSQLSGNNTLTGNNAFGAGKVTIGGSPALSVANVSAASPVTVTTSGSAVKIGLSDSALVTLGNGVYAQLAAANTFTKGQTFQSPVTFASGQTFAGTATLSGSNTFAGSNTFSKAINFASGQTFPGTVSLSANNTFTGSDTFSKAITFASGQTFPGTGTITGVTAGTGLTGGGTSGAVTLNVNAAALESTYNSVYAILTANNTFSGQNDFSNSASTGDGVFASGDFAVVGRGTSLGVLGYTSPLSATGAQYQGDWATIGVQGDGGTGYIGVLATADDGYGAQVANTSGSGFAALEVEANNSESATFVAVNNATGTSCRIDASANLICSGSVSVVHSLGERKVETYGVQSAENWIEDFGTAQLASGSVHVALDPTFAATVNTGVEYHVFLTPQGESEQIYVTNKTADGFDVREARSGRSNIALDYRIVAKRKGSEALRLEDITAKMNADKARRKVVHSSAAKHSRPAAPALRDAKP